MKKRSIKNLSLKKTTVSKLDSDQVQGGKAASITLWNSLLICVTEITKGYCPSLTCPNEE
ncbi:class I lanthipeptide [uncultured Kordia sp.]|uniref:class I lanthipeptide n=1 Tax=uncultured Kordia sp. TaxID=507699 RepID=UPI00260B15DB|nr:class I lanthipeptide [uncultured Kordia sp.]